MTIFVFSYYSFKDPVFQSAVLPYIKAVQDKNLKYVLLTWEQKQHILSKKEIKNITVELETYNIFWKRTKWHSGSFKIVKKLFDFVVGLFYSFILIKKYNANKIFSEGFPGAIIGHYLSKLSGKAHIIHTFEPHADYMLDSGVWKQNSWEYLFLKKLETPIAKHAQHIITATNSFKKILLQKGVRSNVHVIPSCINMDFYFFDAKARNRIRSELKIELDQIVIVYLGKIGGMYMEDDLFSFFQNCLSLDSKRFKFFLFTDYPEKSINQMLKKFNITKEAVYFSYLRKEEVSKYLSAADIGFCGIRAIPSRRYSSPIKNGEYWACGLPTLIPKGISDDYVTIENEKIGRTFSKIEEISREDIEYLLDISRNKVREIALRKRDINSYINNWKTIFFS
ncbi:hypothetical protein QYS48_29555 [Marivirga arenosa]|uniref:Glycosyltransferase subfamily 4-like N-terminal domain-containing protein n=1 Tax=Marivirga arenosa TaxID=3059076 RepID=A0AA51NAU3_9BACT|nr:hypothetical protein [Marivirga sp. ABR2-2]WMN07695.1 hypothetical protein QYS48_29555 [Marivirga sp. ABR2-2]